VNVMKQYFLSMLLTFTSLSSVNGVVTVEPGEHSGARAGRSLRG
jgi:hypothetical protein